MIGGNKDRFTTKYVAVCLPETKTFIKVIDIANNSEKSTAELIFEELPKHFPINMNDVQLDWQKVETYSGGKKYLVGVVEKNIAEEYIQVCQLAGLEIVALEVEAQSIVRSIIYNKDFLKKRIPSLLASLFNKIKKEKIKEKNSQKEISLSKNPKIIIDLGATRASLILVENNIIQFTNSIDSIAGEALTAMIAEKKKLSMVEAEKAKVICGADPKKCKGVVLEIIKEMMDNLAKEIINSDEFYREHFGKESTGLEVLLSGGGANIAGIDKTLSAKLKREIQVADPLINIEEAHEQNIKNIMSYTTAIGLALRNFE